MQLFKARYALFALAVFSVSPAMADLQVHLTFDENVGATAFNSGQTGDLNDALFATDNFRVPGAIGGAVDYNEYITTSTNPTLGDTLRTISFWVNTTQATGLTQYVTFGTNQTGGKFDIGIDAANGGHLEVGVGFGRMDVTQTTVTTPPLNDGTWRLATVVIADALDGDSGIVEIEDIDIYVDGEFSYDGSANNAAGVAVNTTAGALDLMNGAGATDDLAVWDNALTPDEIKGLFDTGSQLSVNAGIYDQVLSLHDSGSGTIYAGDYEWTYASSLASPAGITGTDLVLDDSANTGVVFSSLVPGDVNRNGTADISDFSVILSNFLDPSTSRDDGDLNGDGLVDFFDFRIWSDASANTLSFAQLAAAVPEPSSLFLLVGCGLAFSLRKRRSAVAMLGGLMLAVATTDTAHGQATNVYFDVASGNYNSDSNWDSGFRPEAFLDEIAIIGANTADAILVGAAEDATASLSTSAFDPAGILLGDGFGSVGRLNVTSGGSLTIEGTTSVTSGFRIASGDNGRGFLDISGTGSVTVNTINLNGQTDGLEESEWSAVSLSDSASLVSEITSNGPGTAQFNRVLEITGPDVTLSAEFGMGIGTRGRYYANITDSTHSVITVGDNLDFSAGATLIPTFSGSASAVEGASWDLFDSLSVSGQLEVREDNPQPGRSFVIESNAGGNGVITSLAIRSTLVLEVDRDTGMTQISQPFGSPVSIDGYSIGSASGNLGSNTWTSLDTQNVGDWTEANATSTSLNELKPTSSTVISGAGFGIGQAYTPDFSTFGQAVDEDLVFEYFDTTTQQVVQGQVIYTGTKINDLVLIVDPATGEAQLRNTSNDSVSLDGYKISSEGGSLLTGGWDSLEDQGAGWFEAEASSLTLAELLPGGAEVLGGNQGYNLGSIFSTSGDQDLIIEYLESGANVLQSGQVLYDELPEFADGLAGDYNGDGTVDAADYTVWRDNLGAGDEGSLNGNGDGMNGVDQADYDLWVANYGNSSSSSSSVAVPEASTGILTMLALVMANLFKTRRFATVPVVCKQQAKLPATTKFAAACVMLFLVPAAANSQVIAFDHDFENAPISGAQVASVADLGTPSVGSFSYSGSAVGGIGGGADAAFAFAQNLGVTNTGVTYSGVYPETQVADAGTGDALFAEFDTPLDITSGTTQVDISFDLGLYGTSNTGAFKYQFIRGLDASDNEVFELLFVGGSGNATRSFFARGAADDSTELTAANSGTPDGQSLGSGYNAFLSTNIVNGEPADDYQVDISLSSGMVTYDIVASNGSGTPTSVMGTALAINSSATTISRLEFSGIHNTSVGGQNRGFWLDNVFAGTSPIGTFLPGDVDLDGSVDIDDFNIIAANFKTSVASRILGDLNDDGFVDFDDFQVWKTSPTSAATSSSSLSVPEPTTAMLVLLASTALGLGRRSNR